MLAVCKKFDEEARIIIVGEVREGVNLTNCEDIYLEKCTTEEVEKFIENGNSEEYDYNLIDYLDSKNIDYHYINGYYTSKEFVEGLENFVIISMHNYEIHSPEEYFNGYELEYFYDYWNGSSWETIELSGEGEEVVRIDTLKLENTYQIDLYYNLEDEEFVYIFNSYCQGHLPVSLDAFEYDYYDIDTEAIEEKYKEAIKSIKC